MDNSLIWRFSLFLLFGLFIWLKQKKHPGWVALPHGIVLLAAAILLFHPAPSDDTRLIYTASLLIFFL